MGIHNGLNFINSNCDMTEKATRLCRAYLPGAWKKITCNDIEVSRISGGLSNWLYHVKLQKVDTRDPSPREVLLRLYGQSHGDCGLQNLITESVIFALLSERKLGPRLYGLFTGGRLEEYIPARPLTIKELADPKLTLLIAQKMAAIHSLNLPISKEPNWFWDTSNKWLHTIGDLEMLPSNSVKLKPLLQLDLASELKWLKSCLTKLHCPTVFCHNDMQEGNILMKLDAGKLINEDSLIIIDYEYCAYNYRTFDIANHFIEWVFDYKRPDYPYYQLCLDNYPTLRQQTVFIEKYLSEVGSVEPVEKVINEVQYFSLASHMFWALWSLLNGKISKITFGYWEYAADRLQLYYSLKSKLMKTE